MRFVFFALILFSLSACVTSKHISDAPETWVSDTSNILGLFYNSTYYYCVAQKDPSGGSPKPLCYEAGIVNVGDKIGVLNRK
jgi:hypothetical protein